ncbi:MAG TPA: hypothetical protein VGL29_14545 [Blastocatellia bacterium]|jgi:hypothetical protein
MPWTCPACRIAIQHSEETPRPNIIYRCHVCHLELVADTATGKLTVAPLPAADKSDKQESTKPIGSPHWTISATG